MQQAKTQGVYTLAYSISKLGHTGLYLPFPYIVEIDHKGRLGYMKAQGLPSLLPDYDIHTEGSVHETLLELCTELLPENLEKYFNRQNKKSASVSLLFEDKKFKSLIRHYVDSRLDKFFKLAADKEVPLCLGIERKIHCEDIRMQYADVEARTVLYFRKTQTGVHYTMKLIYGEQPAFSPYEKNIEILSDAPGWLLLQNRLVKLESVNANKLNPFIKKESIFIPAKLTGEFFEKFISDIIGKTEVVTDGFDVTIYDTIDHVTLQFTRDLFSGYMLGELIFSYQDRSFLPGDKSQRKTTIHVDGNGSISVFQIKRNNAKEQEWLDFFINQGLSLNATKRLQTEGEDPFGVLHVIGNITIDFPSNLSIINPEIDGKKIQLTSVTHYLEALQKPDWFEIKGYFEINGEKYPVASIFKNIREQNPFFRLRNGQYFVLPQNLMTKYSDLSVFGSPVLEGWSLPKTHFTLLDCNPAITKKYVNFVAQKETTFVPSPRMLATLRPYQEEGAAWLYNHYQNGLGACLADDMGLGKTLQTLAVLAKVKDEIKSSADEAVSGSGIQLDLFQHTTQHLLSPLQALIVLPASLVFNWYNEINKFVPSFHVSRHVGSKRQHDVRVLRSFDVILTTYQTLLSDFEIFSQLSFRFVILDESQQIRNRNSLSFKALNDLKTAHKISLSGTPVENSLSDLWSQMEFINNNLLGSYSFFKKHFQQPIEKSGDAQAIEKLKTLIRPYILRRTKFQVAPDLPELTEQVYFSEMTADHKKIYDAEKAAARNYITGLDRNQTGYKLHVFTILMRLRLIANHPVLENNAYTGSSGKFEDIRYMLTNICKSGQKVLVFSSFRKHLDLISTWLDEQSVKHLILTGDTASGDRGKLVQTFQEDKSVPVLLISLKAGGVGLNLTAADHVFILDPWWNPFAEAQAVARAHRIGREYPVSVVRFITKDSIEEKILKLQELKKNVSDQIIDINEMPDWIDTHLEDMFQ